MLKEKEGMIANLQNEKLQLEETIKEISASGRKPNRDGKTYSWWTRMVVYDAIVEQVPTVNITKLINKFSTRIGG